MSESDLSLRDDWPARTALIIAHPGHELRVWRWLELVRPLVLAVTNGAGRCGKSRIATTARLVQNCGARMSSSSGAISDRQFYQAVLAKSLGFFRQLVRNMATELVHQRIECVVGDSAEGQIMAHDLIREVRRAAVQQAQAMTGRPIQEFEFSLESEPSAHPRQVARDLRKVQLSDFDLARKLTTALGYLEIRPFVLASIGQFGERAFAVECLFPCIPESLIAVDHSGKRAYEVHGQKLEKSGEYPQAIGFREHVLPIIESLHSRLERNAA